MLIMPKQLFLDSTLALLVAIPYCLCQSWPRRDFLTRRKETVHFWNIRKKQDNRCICSGWTTYFLVFINQNVVVTLAQYWAVSEHKSLERIHNSNFEHKIWWPGYFQIKFSFLLWDTPTLKVDYKLNKTMKSLVKYEINSNEKSHIFRVNQGIFSHFLYFSHSAIH